MNILLINDSSSNPNWGDRAAAIALKHMISDLGYTLNDCITENELSDGSYLSDTKMQENSKNRSVLNKYIKLLLPPVIEKIFKRIFLKKKNTQTNALIPLEVDDYEKKAISLINNKKDHFRLFNAIENSDIVVIHGDGCMVGNGILPRSELFLAYLMKTRFSKVVILINHTTDFSHPSLNKMAELVYPLLDDVTYRDKYSEELCQGRWKGRYAADSAFQFLPADFKSWSELCSRPTYFDIWPDKSSFDPKLPYICIGGSSIHSFTANGPQTELIQGYINLVKHLNKIFSHQIVLTASDIKDEQIFRPIADSLALPLIGLTTPVQQAVDIIGNADAYIGGRWHVSIFALSGGTPVIPLTSKTFKINALVEMAGLPTVCFDANNLQFHIEEISQTVEKFLVQGKTLRYKLKSWATEQRENSWDNLSILTK